MRKTMTIQVGAALTAAGTALAAEVTVMSGGAVKSAFTDVKKVKKGSDPFSARKGI